MENLLDRLMSIVEMLEEMENTLSSIRRTLIDVVATLQDMPR